jgi:hypothetical protein
MESVSRALIPFQLNQFSGECAAFELRGPRLVATGRGQTEKAGSGEHEPAGAD